MTRIAWLPVIVASSLLVPAHSVQQLRASVATVASNGATVWRYDDATRTFAQSWQSATFFASGAQLYIGDYTGDGVNDLVVTDMYGITVYGSTPAYYPLPEAGLYRDVHLVAADLDGNGSIELITNRNAPNAADAIEVWRVADGRLSRLGTVTELHPRSPYVLVQGDADNDGHLDLVTAFETITIFKPTTPTRWEPVAELPFVGNLADVVRVADVDGDGKNEILATGNSGMLTIYRYRKVFGRETYPVIWQSPMLRDKDLARVPGNPMQGALTQGLAVGDLNGDGKPEILVGTVEFGVFPNSTSATNRGHIHVFEPDAWRRGFVQTWRSDWTESAAIPAFSIGDLDGDGVSEFVYNAVEVYGYNKAKATYERRATLPTRSQPPAEQPKISAIGVLPELREPSRATRIVLAGSALKNSFEPGERADVSVSLRSAWAPARDVTLEVTSTSGDFVVRNGVLRVGSIESGAVVASPPFTIEAQRPPPVDPDATSPARYLMLTITAAGGYRQSIPMRMSIAGS